MSTDPIAADATKTECEAAARVALEKVERPDLNCFKCLPDTVDPREPKAK